MYELKIGGKQISFQYYDYTGLKKKVLKNKGEIYKLSPYKLLWCGDYYYVLGYSEKKSKVINFRVDHIASKPEILDKDIVPMPDDFDIENYTKEVFFMFSGEKVIVANGASQRSVLRSKTVAMRSRAVGRSSF